METEWCFAIERSKGYCQPISVSKVRFSSFLSLVNPLRHADGTSGTDKTAEMTTYAAGTDDVRTTCRCVEGDGLMATIHAGRIATSATNASFGVNLGIDNGAAIQVGR